MSIHNRAAVHRFANLAYLATVLALMVNHAVAVFCVLYFEASEVTLLVNVQLCLLALSFVLCATCVVIERGNK